MPSERNTHKMPTGSNYPSIIYIRIRGMSRTPTPSPPLHTHTYTHAYWCFLFVAFYFDLALLFYHIPSFSWSLSFSTRSSILSYKPRTTASCLRLEIRDAISKHSLYPRTALLLNYKIPAPFIGAEALVNVTELSSPEKRLRENRGRDLINT